MASDLVLVYLAMPKRAKTAGLTRREVNEQALLVCLAVHGQETTYGLIVQLGRWYRAWWVVGYLHRLQRLGAVASEPYRLQVWPFRTRLWWVVDHD